MLYDNYREKILRRAEILRRLIKLIPLFAVLLSLIAAALSALAILKGNVMSVEFKNTMEYGSVPEYKLSAFMSDVHIEYSPKGAESWSAEIPYLPGEYDVRAVSQGTFGEKYHYIDVFTVLPKKLSVTVSGGSVPYGEVPGVTASINEGETIVCGGFVYENKLAVQTKIKADASKVKIYNANGEDITAAYEIETPYADVTITPRELVIIVADASHEYDGKKFSHSLFELGKGTLVAGDMLQAKFEKTITDVGTVLNTPTVSIVSANGDDVTHFYKINEKYVGYLTVTKRPLHITTGSAEYDYDGRGHSCLEYTISSHTSLAEGHEIVVSGAKTLTDAGSAKNSMSFSVKDANGNDVTKNYSIIVEEGTITVNKRKVTVTTGSGKWEYDGTAHSNTTYTHEGVVFGNISTTFQNVTFITDVGTAENKFAISVFSGTSDITQNYDITYEYGTLEVTKRKIKVLTPSASWVYDGVAHMATTAVNQNPTLLEGSLAAKEELAVNALNAITITDVGTVTNTQTYAVMNGAKDTTANYEIEYEYGTLKVTPRPIIIYPKAVAEIYDGKPHSSDEIEFASLKPALGSHMLMFDIEGSKTNVLDTDTSVLKNVKIVDTEDGRDVTFNYDITCREGTIVIIQRTISISSVSDEKTYDGFPLTNSKFVLTDDSPHPLVEGHTLGGKTTGSQTEIGQSPNSYLVSNVKVYDGKKDVTSNYNIISNKTGTLTVKPVAKITVISGSASKVYDGTPLIYREYDVKITEGELMEGHTVAVRITGSITSPGKVKNTIGTLSVRDNHGKDVSYMYELETVHGELIVEAKDGGSGGASDTVFLKLKTDCNGVVYLKMKSYGSYNLQHWNNAAPYTALIEDKYNASYFTSVALKNAGYKLYTANVTSCQAYMLPFYASPSGTYPVPADDVNVYEAFESFPKSYTAQFYTLTDYSNKLASLKGNLGEYSDEELSYREFVYENYLEIDRQTLAYMRNIISQNGFNANSGDIITKVASYIKKAAKYNMEYDKNLDREDNVAIAFLSEYKEGKCVHYATAATLLFRALGIPARYVEGFAVATQSGVTTNVKNPGHAWTEIYIDGVGWVCVEVTPGYENESDKNTLIIEPTYQHKVYDGITLYAQNKIVETPELAKLLDEGYTYVASVAGAQASVGKGKSTITAFRLINPHGKDVTDEYNIVYRTGVLEVLPKSIETIYIYLYEVHKTYDGKPVTFGEYDYEIIKGGEGMDIDISFNMSFTDACKITLSRLNANVYQYVSYTVKDNGRDVTSAYRIQFGVFDDMNEKDYVPVEITRRAITLTAASASKVYDGKELTAPGVGVTFGTLANGDKLTATASGSIIEVGKAVNTVKRESVIILNSSGEDVTGNYDIKLQSGELTVIDSE